MPLREVIREEIKAGRLARTWNTSDLRHNRRLTRKYADTTLVTEPPNHSTSLPGLGLGNGFHVNLENPLYRRVGRRGRSIIYALPEHAPSVA